MQRFHLEARASRLRGMRLRIVLALAGTAALALPAAASADVAHVVAKGESLTSIAATDGLSVSALAGANGLAPDAELITGSRLEIPPRGPRAAAEEASTSTSTSTSTSRATYTVRRGDTLSGIAARFGLSMVGLAAENGIRPSDVLIAGRVLSLPQSSGSASEAAVTDTTRSSSGPPYPTPERVTASQVEQVAGANGVPASLAAAIAWQESGFNNDFVSSADARGVMQILPGTWGWIQQTMAGGTPLEPASAIDNVRAGVLLLRSLLLSTGGDQALAAAAYIQGLTSVRRYGIFPATQVYVNNILALRERFGGP
ncbi:MAG TPA: LysM peptidoglycan-binding domain-containing protein [Solirubrobacteraceae bacterium]|nr:LysM peptidoglycan-binding domain-containing protein [Solirubrobacteraceae bacterium]